MGDIFNEVNEDVRREQLIGLWRRYGMYLLATLTAIIIGTAAHGVWTHFKNQRMMANGGLFSAAVELSQLGQYEVAAQKFSDLASDSGSGYSQLAKLQKAATFLKTEDYTTAISLYSDLAAQPGTDKVIAPLATILAAIHESSNNQPNNAIARLAELSENDGPWRHLAREVRALALIQSGNMEEARKILVTIVGDPTSLPGVRSRASEILGALHDTSG